MEVTLKLVCIAIFFGFVCGDDRIGSEGQRKSVSDEISNIIKNCPHKVTADHEDLIDFALTHYPEKEIPENFACFLECAMKSFDKKSLHMDENGAIHLDLKMVGSALPEYQACVDKLTETDLCKKAHKFYSTCMRIPIQTLN